MDHKRLKGEPCANDPFEWNGCEQMMLMIDLQAPSRCIDGGGHPLTTEAMTDPITLQINADRASLVNFPFEMDAMPGAQPGIRVNGGWDLWQMRQTGKGSQGRVVGTTEGLIRTLEIGMIAKPRGSFPSLWQSARTILEQAFLDVESCGIFRRIHCVGGAGDHRPRRRCHTEFCVMA
jgi:hypothetical protein